MWKICLLLIIKNLRQIVRHVTWLPWEGTINNFFFFFWTATVNKWTLLFSIREEKIHIWFECVSRHSRVQLVFFTAVLRCTRWVILMNLLMFHPSPKKEKRRMGRILKKEKRKFGQGRRICLLIENLYKQWPFAFSVQDSQSQAKGTQIPLCFKLSQG